MQEIRANRASKMANLGGEWEIAEDTDRQYKTREVCEIRDYAPLLLCVMIFRVRSERVRLLQKICTLFLVSISAMEDDVHKETLSNLLLLNSVSISWTPQVYKRGFVEMAPLFRLS